MNNCRIFDKDFKTKRGQKTKPTSTRSTCFSAVILNEVNSLLRVISRLLTTNWDTANISQVLVSPPKLGALSIRLATMINFCAFLDKVEISVLEMVSTGMNFFCVSVGLTCETSASENRIVPQL